MNTSRKWSKVELYVFYWTGYLLLFTLIEGSTEHDYLQVFRNELISLVPKAIFVALVMEKLFDELIKRKRFFRFFSQYMLLIMLFAFLLRIVDNYIILEYFIRHWAKEPLLSAAPFLYNIIKLQFLLTVPFCFELYRYSTTAQTPGTAVPADHESSFLQVKSERRMINIPFDEIYYLEIFTTNGAFKTYLSISELEEKLPQSKFLRIHRSFIIALARVESYNYNQAFIADKVIPISRSYAANFKKRVTTSPSLPFS